MPDFSKISYMESTLEFFAMIGFIVVEAKAGPTTGRVYVDRVDGEMVKYIQLTV